jgi:hypothetical protein
MTAGLISDVYVAGRWRPARSDGVDTVVDPTTEEVIARVVNPDVLAPNIVKVGMRNTGPSTDSRDE